MSIAKAVRSYVRRGADAVQVAIGRSGCPAGAAINLFPAESSWLDGAAGACAAEPVAVGGVAALAGVAVDGVAVAGVAAETSDGAPKNEAAVVTTAVNAESRALSCKDRR